MSCLRIAYELLPPPLAALPAKYWTSISLWLHSYTVARTFQEFVTIYSEARDVDTPSEDDAFLIGFLHDIGQKLRLRGKPSEEGLVEWIRDVLMVIGYTEGEADELVRYLYTNPAETLFDPLYDRSIWRLLWLADRLQGIDNPLAILQLLAEAKDDLGLELNIALLNITIPQPFMRTLLSRIVHKNLEQMTRNEGKLVIPITTPYGLAVITDEPSLTIEINWDEIRKGFNGNGMLDEKTEEDLEWNMNCCTNPECKSECSKRKKPSVCREHRFTKRDCEKGVYPGSKGNSYRIALIYYGFKKRVNAKVILPDDIRYMFQGISIKEVEYISGRYMCPLCGAKTPVGITGDFLQFFNTNITTEQWMRRLYPGSVNRLMQDVKPYSVDPLCLGEVILRSRAGYPVLISLTLRALVPLPVLEEVGKLAYYLVFQLGTSIPKRTTVSSLLYDDNGFEKTLENVANTLPSIGVPKFYYDAFTSTVVVPYRRFMQSHQDEWIRDIIVAGILAAWGLYPLTISETVPSAPSNVLLSYYKGRRPLYDYQPSDKKLGDYTPYVATTMTSLAELNHRANTGENLPALLEVLDYPPEHSPLLLQYTSPSLYSRLESLRVRIGVRP